MMDLYYKATTEAELYTKLPAEMLTKNDAGEEILQTHSQKWAWDWDIPHKISDDIIDLKTNEIITPAVFSTDFHANLRLLDESVDMSSLAEFLITPNTPDRRFA